MPPADGSLPHYADAFAAFVGVVVLFYGWRGLGGIPWAPRLVIGTLLAAIVVPAFGAVILALGEAGRDTGPRAEVAYERMVPAGQAPTAARQQPAVETTAAEPRGGEVVTSPEQPAQKPPAEKLPPAAQAALVAPASPSFAAGPAPLAPPSAPGPSHAVTVLFGTDRAPASDGSGDAYGFERAGRLQLGEARVTVELRGAPGHEPGDGSRAPKPAPSVRVLSEDEFVGGARRVIEHAGAFKDRALVVIHGYNTGLAEAVQQAAALLRDSGFDGVPFVYSWPSVGKLPSYSYDRESARASAQHLRRFFDLVVRQAGAKSVSVVAYGLGAEPLLGAVLDPAMPPMTLGEVILTGPDLAPADLVDRAAGLAATARGITLYVAANDRGLSVARRFHGGSARAGDVPETGPLVIGGVDTIDVTAAGPEGLGPAGVVGGDIAALLRTGERAAKRSANVQPARTAKGGLYWRFPALH